MDIYFQGLMNENVIVYMNFNVTVYSKHYTIHIKHLTKIFERCKKIIISLNLKKSILVVTQGKILGHIISKEGITIDPKWVKSVSLFSLPHNKKAMQYFFRKINFVRKSIVDSTETIRPLQKMIKK